LQGIPFGFQLRFNGDVAFNRLRSSRSIAGMAVNIHRHEHRGVTELIPHCLGRYSGLPGPRCERVPEVVP